MIIKVCGMKYSENIRELENAGADMTGFIFHEQSPRYVSEKPDFLPTKSLRVGVFVNKETDYIISKYEDFKLDLVQLHGNESPDICKALIKKGIDIIKVFHINDDKADGITSPYDGLCRYFLFDTPCMESGGSGRRFNWNLLQYYHGNTPFLLSGGIGPESLPDLQNFKHPRFAGIDLNSRFEISPAIKDIKSVSTFIDKVRTIKIQ